MFAAGRKASGTGAGGGDAAQVNDDWLSVGKSFASGTGEDKPKARREDTEASESALQVYKHSKHRHKEKKKKKEKKQRSSDVDGRHLSKHKKKSKDRKRRRSWSPSGSSDEDDTHRSRRRSRRRRHRSRSNSRSRSASRPRSHRDESRIVTQSDKALALHETPGEEKLFEVDCVGDRENRFFGSTYAHDQPLYDLATRRNLLTGAWISRTRPKLSGVEMHRKQKENQGSDRYFSVRARKLERDGGPQ
ncbi:uncharacterized protein IUM83_00020 [Phytophthora cinnamomi]|uniref:uncharacterized protein n=1 Tax=Phytophthora cinnamomi TaxID=4785 RepID=UPI00355A7B1A|nr:hypothetical protein IUM83_00020 [Phytophthora cinnamomi]